MIITQNYLIYEREVRLFGIWKLPLERIQEHAHNLPQYPKSICLQDVAWYLKPFCKVHWKIADKMYQIKYWVQETPKIGRWELTPTMPYENALTIFHLFKRAKIIPDTLTKGQTNE